MSGLITAGLVLAAGTAAYSGYAQNKASKDAAEAQRSGVTPFNPVQPTYQLTGLNKPQTVDWRSAVNDALNYNINHQARQQEFAAQTNVFNTRQAQRQYRTFQPYFDTLQSQIGKNSLSYSKGELPADVLSSLGRGAATRGLAGGFGQGFRGGGTGTALGNSLIRGMGLTSLDLSKFGTQMAMQAGLQAKQLSPALFDPTSLAVSPQQAVGYQMQNANTMNSAAQYWNQLQNSAGMNNVSAQNTANQNATNTELAGQLAQAQAIQQAGSSLSGVAGQYATNQNYMPQGSGTYGAPAYAGAAAPNAPAGYGYNQGGFYKLS